jgi:hypothetical protein
VCSYSLPVTVCHPENLTPFCFSLEKVRTTSDDAGVKFVSETREVEVHGWEVDTRRILTNQPTVDHGDSVDDS